MRCITFNSCFTQVKDIVFIKFEFPLVTTFQSEGLKLINITIYSETKVIETIAKAAIYSFLYGYRIESSVLSIQIIRTIFADCIICT